MKYYDIEIKQFKNYYEMYNQHSIKVLALYMPADMQYVQDSMAIQAICKTLAYRYGIIESNKEIGNKVISYDKGGIYYRQYGVSEYAICLPNNNIICLVRFPPNHQYIFDACCLEIISRNLALRYKLVEPQKRKKKPINRG